MFRGGPMSGQKFQTKNHFDSYFHYHSPPPRKTADPSHLLEEEK